MTLLALSTVRRAHPCSCWVVQLLGDTRRYAIYAACDENQLRLVIDVVHLDRVSFAGQGFRLCGLAQFLRSMRVTEAVFRSAS